MTKASIGEKVGPYRNSCRYKQVSPAAVDRPRHLYCKMSMVATNVSFVQLQNHHLGVRGDVGRDGSKPTSFLGWLTLLMHPHLLQLRISFWHPCPQFQLLYMLHIL